MLDRIIIYYILSSTERIYSISDDLSYFGGTIRIITTQGDLYQAKALPININIHNLLNKGSKRFPILVSWSK